ncbi:DUF2188 domain-containing protein [Fictibacillus sp. KIGAM418]|uniref:DUF2188 domain-containing protein n=1 Tax=Fictibacillus marinisediminis TaxID=2878389 RepID=A0A9X1XAC1_9BACL|nr:DUF2188 domain-containing protein [Fictibacillus marinisediminis]MCK6255660.1 DUF2188 domain-containing protein [Fictibacillus marinisediminis]
MNDYSVVPDQGENGWIVKIQDVAPTDTFPSRAEAIAKAEKLATEDKPSRVLVYDTQLKVEEEKMF